MSILQRHLVRRALNSNLKLVICGSCRNIVIVQTSNYFRSLGPIETFAQIRRRAFSASVIKVNTEKIKSPEQAVTHVKPSSSAAKSKDSSTQDERSAVGTDWLLASEKEKYELGKRWLATMMGEDVEAFTDEKVAEAIRYLLPSHLFAKDARPIMKDPVQLFGQKKETQIGQDGRPFHAAFFTGQPAYHELIFKIWENLEKLDEIEEEMQKFEGEEEAPIYYDKPLLVRWMKHYEMEEKLKCRLSQDQYDLLIRRLTRIAKHPQGEKMQEFLSEYQVELSQGGKKIEVAEIDEDGYATVMGYRKTAVAEVRLKEGSGKIMVNNMPMTKCFDNFLHRQQILYPFMVTDQLGRFDVDAGVIGGGQTGKAGAIRLGISRALLSFSQSFYQPLEDAGLLKRDTRKVERKKPGRMKARRKFAWVKR